MNWSRLAILPFHFFVAGQVQPSANLQYGSRWCTVFSLLVCCVIHYCRYLNRLAKMRRWPRPSGTFCCTWWEISATRCVVLLFQTQLWRADPRRQKANIETLAWHRENTCSTSLSWLVSVRRDGQCKLSEPQDKTSSRAQAPFWPSAQFMLRQMHWTNLSVSIEAKYLLGFLAMKAALGFVILCSNRWLKIEVTAWQK